MKDNQAISGQEYDSFLRKWDIKKCDHMKWRIIINTAV